MLAEARGPTPPLGAGSGLAAPRHGVARLRLSFGLRLHYVKIGTLAFVSSRSENISFTTFLEYKNNRKQELALWHLVNRLVQENA